MANVLIPKKSTVAAKVPTTSDLALGEIAINHADAKLFARHPVSGAVQEIGGGSGSVTIDTTAADLLSFSSGTLTADDLGSDQIYFWDDSAGRATGLSLGTGLEISGTTLNATATGSVTSVSATGPITSSGGSTPTISTSIATNRLVGRSTAGTGAMEEITIGTGLTLANGTLSNQASISKTILRLPVQFNQPPATAFATLDTRNSIAVLDFDAAAVESAVFASIIPEASDLSSGLLIRLVWMATSATSGDVRWRVALERGNTDLNSDSFDTAAEANGAANATSGIPSTTEITLTTIDSLAAGELFRLRVTRVGNDATNDTMTGDAELIAVEVRGVA